MDFLSYWADENYGKMAASLVASDGETKQLGDLHRKFEHLEGQSSERVDIDEMARAQRTITVTVEVELFEETISAIRPIAVTRVDVDGRPAVPEHEDGTWTITNHIVLTTRNTRSTSWRTPKGRDRLGRPPTPQYRVKRGAQRDSRERSK